MACRRLEQDVVKCGTVTNVRNLKLPRNFRQNSLPLNLIKLQILYALITCHFKWQKVIMNVTLRYWILTIILNGQTRRGKARRSSGCTDSYHSDLMPCTSKWLLLTRTLHSQKSSDTHVVILSNMSKAPLSVLSFLYYLFFIKNYYYFLIFIMS